MTVDILVFIASGVCNPLKFSVLISLREFSFVKFKCLVDPFSFPIYV